MSKREKEKTRSLDALARIAYSSGAPPPAPPKPAPPPAPARPRPQAPSPPPSPRAAESDRARRAQAAERKAKLEEESALKKRRANELARGARMDMSRIDPFNIPASIRRTGFDRHEPSVAQKLQDILGEAKEMEGRAKAKQKGKRQGGR